MNGLDWGLEGVCVGLLMGLFLAVSRAYPALPARIPSHFGFRGLPDRWGPKGIIWVIPIVGLIETVAFSLPRILHAPGDMSRFLLVLNVELLVLLLFVVKGQIGVAMGCRKGIGAGLWAMLLVLFGTIFFVVHHHGHF